MTFLWPDLLWALALVPALVALYVWLLRRRKKAALRYASLTMVREALGAGQTIRRHVPPVLFLLALIAMIVAMARPAAVVTLPSQRDTVILAMDVSGSMRATDVQPNRLAAAQAAARAFVADQPRHTRIGVVSFAGTAAVVQAPTLSREDVVAAIDRFQLQRGTAVGSGLLVALKTILPDVEFDLRSANPRVDPAGESKRGARLDRPRDPAAKAPPKPVPPGSYASAVIILLTDGQTTAGPDPIESARIAADRGVRVYTVGVGTRDGQVLGFEGWSFRARLDEDALKTIANVTLGEYFYAGTAADLKKIYQSMNSRIVLEKKETEVTALFAAGAAVLAVLAALLSLLWFNRILWSLLERIAELVNGDPGVVRWGRHMNESFMVEVGDQQYLITVREGRVESVAKGPFVMRSWRFAIRARRECWEKFWAPVPAPGWHDLFALLRRGDVAFEGDQRVLMAYLLYVKLLLAAPRRLAR